LICLLLLFSWVFFSSRLPGGGITFFAAVYRPGTSLTLLSGTSLTHS
jgi:hypothetical protein